MRKATTATKTKRLSNEVSPRRSVLATYLPLRNITRTRSMRRMAAMYNNLHLDAIIEQLVEVAPESSDILESKKFRRLDEISFLGAIDAIPKHFFCDSKSAGTRWEHSLWVAYIAFLLSEAMGVSKGDQKQIVLRALTHDVGHGPLSHSTERFFYKWLGVNHHSKTNEIIHNEWFGVFDNSHQFENQTILAFFESKINADTLEGICRSSSYFSAPSEFNFYVLIDSFKENVVDQCALDSFWNLKNTVYREYIYDSYYVYDVIIEKSLDRMADKIDCRDFELTDSQFFEKYYCAIENTLGELADDGWEAPPKKPQGFARSFAERNFVIDESVPLKNYVDINERYKTITRANSNI